MENSRMKKVKKNLLHKIKQKKKRDAPLTLENDDLWYYFNLSEKNLKVVNKIGPTAINDARKQYFELYTAPNVKKATQHNRSILKDFYLRNQPVNWIATAGDISLSNDTHGGRLLLYHVAIEKINDTIDTIPILYVPRYSQFQAIDHHLWLSVSDIKYFGRDKEYLDIAYGDVLVGTSMVKKYHGRDGQDKFTLGTTIIRKSGIIEGKDYDYTLPNDDPNWMAMTNAKIADYNHDGTEMLRLSYNQQSKKFIEDKNDISVANLNKNNNFYLTTKFNTENTFNFHQVLKKNHITDIRDQLSDAAKTKTTVEKGMFRVHAHEGEEFKSKDKNK